jgi:hypothetical protein
LWSDNILFDSDYRSSQGDKFYEWGSRIDAQRDKNGGQGQNGARNEVMPTLGFSVAI